MVGAALGVALVASATLALASPPDALRVQVTAVRAAESGPSDPQLVSLKPRLRQMSSKLESSAFLELPA